MILAALGLWLLAAAAHRFRRESGVSRAGERIGLRVIGSAALLASAGCCGTPVTGEWSVRCLAAASIAGVLLVLALSAAPAALFLPLRRVLATRR